MPAAVHAGSPSLHVSISQQMENIMMLMMSEGGKKETHRRPGDEWGGGCRQPRKTNSKRVGRRSRRSSSLFHVAVKQNLSRMFLLRWCYWREHGVHGRAVLLAPPSHHHHPPQICHGHCKSKGSNFALMSTKPTETQEKVETATFLSCYWCVAYVIPSFLIKEADQSILCFCFCLCCTFPGLVLSAWPWTLI